MTKKSFINQLKFKMMFMPEQTRRDTIAYYEEIISEKIEAGMPESEAVRSCGSVQNIISEVKSNSDAVQPSVKKTMPRVLKFFLIATAIVWGPVVFALGITALCVIVSLGATAIGLLVGFGVGGIAALLYVIPNIFIGISIGAATSEILHSTGLLLMCGSVSCIFAYGAAIICKQMGQFSKKLIARRSGK